MARSRYHFTEYNRPHFLRRRDSAWKRRRDKTRAIKQGMRQPSVPHRPGAAGMRELAPRSGEMRDTAERCHEGLRRLLPIQGIQGARRHLRFAYTTALDRLEECVERIRAFVARRAP